MSEIESQTQDLHKFQEHLERICKDLEDGVIPTLDEIGDLRYACGLPSPVKPNLVLNEVFKDFSTIFGATK